MALDSKIDDEAVTGAQSSRNYKLNQLVRHFAAPLRRFFERRVLNQSDVPDLVQDVFLRLSRLQSLSGIEKPENYIFTTAVSALRDHARGEIVRQTSFHTDFNESLHGLSEMSPERVLGGKQAVGRLHQALGTLPERTRDIAILRMFEGLNMAETAKAIGISQRAAEKHYAKAIVYIAKRVGSYGDC